MGSGFISRGGATGLALSAMLALLGSCESPTRDQAALRAIKAESERLMATHPIKPGTWATIPKSAWPPAIARLEPFDVVVFEWGVDITIKPGLDGGWGYEIPRDRHDLPMPAGCYSEPGPGVFWHGPC